MRVTRNHRLTAAQLDRWIAIQRQWIADHGHNITGYVERYGSVADPNHYGDGGERIYDADWLELIRLTELRRRQ